MLGARVALRKESVDRNRTPHHKNTRPIPVALRKESVDRNPPMCTIRQMLLVALRKESVDRNRLVAGCLSMLGGRSPQGERG